jgi:hypothetical protein
VHPLLPGWITAVILVLLLALPVSGSSALASTDPEPPTTIESPGTTVNDFIPEDQNLSDCLGALERPGCGSESRGGWRQTVTFSVMALGLVLVFGRIFWSLRTNHRS